MYNSRLGCLQNSTGFATQCQIIHIDFVANYKQKRKQYDISLFDFSVEC